MAYTKTVWVNDSEPDIDAENLNKIEQGIYDAHQTMASLVSGVKGDAETEFRNGNVNLTKANIGLGNVDNTSDANKPVSTATATALAGKVDKVTGKQLSTEDYTTAEKTKLGGIEAGAQVNTITGVKGDAESSYRTGNVNITKANVGLGNVDNTSDANKPVSTAVQTALNGKQNTLTFDNSPTAGSSNPVKSSGVKTALDNQKYFYVDAEGYGCINYDLF